MRWLRRKLQDWILDYDRYEDAKYKSNRSHRYDDFDDLDDVFGSSDLPSVRCDLKSSPNYTLRIFSANGGTVVEFRYHTGSLGQAADYSVHLIHENENFGEALASIVMQEKMTKG